jgi:hypothetical protein
MDSFQTTLFLIPGGRELALPENADKLRNAMKEALASRTATIIMLADKPLLPENELQSMARFKNVLALETNAINNEEDAWSMGYESQADNYLPVLADAGFDFQVVKMKPVAIKYEDFEILEKYM